MARVSGSVDSLLTSSGLLSGAVIGNKFSVVLFAVDFENEKTCAYKTLALTFSRCVVDVRWLAWVAFAHIIDGNDPETVGHVWPQWEASMLLVTSYSLQLFPTPLHRTLVLKFNHILCRERKRESKRDGERQEVNNKEAIET